MYIRPRSSFYLREVYEGYLQELYKEVHKAHSLPCRPIEYATYEYGKRSFYKVRYACLDRLINPREVFRSQPLIEDAYYTLGFADKIDIGVARLKLSMEDFVVHLHIWGDSFSKTPKEIRKDLDTVSDKDYFRVLDSLYTDVVHLPRLRKRVLIYLRKGHIYSAGRVSHKLYRRLSGIPDKYFTKKELEAISKGIITCNRVNFYRGVL